MLAGLSVIEVSCPHSMLAGQVLADLGADVLVIEPPGGAPGRRLGPFLDDRPGLEHSLTWAGMNRNKRGITLDLDSGDGLDIAAALIERADVLIEPAPARCTAHDRLLHCVLRGFSAAGPKRGYACTDPVLWAATGVPAHTGDGDRPPLLAPVPQPMMEAGADAAVGILGALAARERDGAGQRVEVSTRAAAMMSALGLPYFATANDSPPRRGQGRQAVPGIQVPSVYACKDGFVMLTIAFAAFAGMTERMAAWLIRRGDMPHAHAQVDWANYPADVRVGRQTLAPLRGLIDGLHRALATLTKAQVGEAAQRERFFAAPLMDMADIGAFAQYRERGLWAALPLVDGREVAAPARFAQFSDYRIEQRRPAPRLSEHTAEVLAGLGYSGLEIQALFHHRII
ncbi:hypothetical protein FOZ76_00475 [Verticiella sediminum]|uniref:CoA transferase n=1 Tax=Verticiella sediminum TaxID=1247510 RepID=A0A556B226_9BURK|nr:CoA transferase [Verticiella sediminum]TSH99241.1 hypothetical protein FOZ76_00475 [Verticiella sediminum]